MKIFNKIRIYFLRTLRKAIKIFYKNRFLKLLYGVISIDPEKDKFARENGIIEFLYSRKIIKIDNPISNEFIISRFKRGAQRYEKVVKESGYTSSELAKCSETVTTYYHKIKEMRIDNKIELLDLGCGTGLLGTKISHLNLLLTGVDISNDMLSECKRKNLYQKVFCDDLINFLEKSNKKYDIITASSVIPFFSPGKLQRLLELVSKNISPEGCFIFSFDTCKEEFKINEKLFCEHSENLIRKISSNFFSLCEIDIIDNCRIESKKIVKGAICTCRN